MINPAIFSFFAGAGFLDLGFEESGFKPYFVNELHKPFLSSYKFARNRMNMDEPLYGYHNGNIEDLMSSSELKSVIKTAKSDTPFTGFIGGPPCPDFSVGGKNKGRFGDKGKLSLAYIELIASCQPDFFLFENVKGLWQTATHRVFYEELKYILQSAGYITTERLINSIEYGAPQDRNRIILLGFHKNLLSDLHLMDSTSRESILPFGLFPWEVSMKYKSSIMTKANWPQMSPFLEDSNTPQPEGITEELTVEHWFKRNNVTEHYNAERAFTPREALPKFRTIEEGDNSKKSFKRLHRWRFSPTAAYGNNEVHIHPYKPRRISASEALAIQSLPEQFALPNDITLSDTFKAIGNGVPYLAAKGIAASIRQFLEVGEDAINSTGHRSEYKLAKY